MPSCFPKAVLSCRDGWSVLSKTSLRAAVWCGRCRTRPFLRLSSSARAEAVFIEAGEWRSSMGRRGRGIMEAIGLSCNVGGLRREPRA